MGEKGVKITVADPKGAEKVLEAEMVLVAFLGRQTTIERDAEAGPIEGLLHVMGRERIAGKKDVQIAVAESFS